MTIKTNVPIIKEYKTVIFAPCHRDSIIFVNIKKMCAVDETFKMSSGKNCRDDKWRIGGRVSLNLKVGIVLRRFS
jgi:hypothetical protein